MKLRRSLAPALWLPATLAATVLALPATAGATILPPFGSNLQATPTLDTANGATAANNDAAAPGDNGIMPNPHSAADTAVWNSQLASGSNSAPQGGQVLDVRVKGCAVKDTSVPSATTGSDGKLNGTASDGTQYSDGVPVNMIHIQTLTPQSGGSWKVDQSSQAFYFPFCGDNGASTSTVTTFQPLHMCLQSGEIVDFNDIGGFIPNSTGPSWYPQGVPYKILAQVAGSHMNSYVRGDGTNIGATFAPTDTTPPNGWGDEPSEELLLQVVEGVGDDAYGLCPGGAANESSSSNTVICVYHHTNPGDPYGTCNSSGEPVRPNVNQAPPGITSPSGAYQVGQRLNAVRGTWTTDPNSTSQNYAYQWQDCDGAGNNCSNISGATNTWYYPTSSDVGHTIRVQEFATNNAGTQGPATSAPTAAIAAKGSSSSSGSNSGSSSSSSKPGTPPAKPPVIRRLKLNPGSWIAGRGATITYTDSEAARTTLVVLNSRGKVVKKFAHADRAGKIGIGHELGGLRAGVYHLRVTSVFQGRTGRVVIVRFVVKPKPKRKHATRRHARRK